MGKSIVIRSVVPIKDVEILIKTAAPAKAVHTATGQRARCERNGEWLQVRLNRLDEYDVLLIDMASQLVLTFAPMEGIPPSATALGCGMPPHT